MKQIELKSYLHSHPESRLHLSGQEIAHLVFQNGQMPPEWTKQYNLLEHPPIPYPLISPDLSPKFIQEIWGTEINAIIDTNKINGPTQDISQQISQANNWHKKRSNILCNTTSYALDTKTRETRIRRAAILQKKLEESKLPQSEHESLSLAEKDELLGKFNKALTTYPYILKYVSTQEIIERLEMSPKEKTQLFSYIILNRKEWFVREGTPDPNLLHIALEPSEIKKIWGVNTIRTPQGPRYPDLLSDQILQAKAWKKTREGFLNRLKEDEKLKLSFTPKPTSDITAEHASKTVTNPRKVEPESPTQKKTGTRVSKYKKRHRIADYLRERPQLQKLNNASICGILPEELWATPPTIAAAKRILKQEGQKNKKEVTPKNENIQRVTSISETSVKPETTKKMNLKTKNKTKKTRKTPLPRTWKIEIPDRDTFSLSFAQVLFTAPNGKKTLSKKEIIKEVWSDLELNPKTHNEVQKNGVLRISNMVDHAHAFLTRNEFLSENSDKSLVLTEKGTDFVQGN